LAAIFSDSLVTAQDEQAFFVENREVLLKQLREHGAVVVRGFQSTKQPEGFEQMWKTLGLEVMMIHSRVLHAGFLLL
jgi:hypothetical protein